MNQYAVNFWYDFGSDHATYLFQDVQDAKNFLKDNYEAEVQHDKDNGYWYESNMEEDGYETKIVEYLPSGLKSTTLMFISSICG